ncbi:MAG: hypothetical protein AABZ47_16050 [Planctomycetota bacterium]
MNLQTSLEPILRVEPARWQGLHRATVAEFDALFASPEESIDAVLGYYPATRRRYRTNTGQGLMLWARAGEAVMVETLVQPAASVLNELPNPCAILAHEILVPDAYAHEYLYCAIGLVLTVAQPLRGDVPFRIIRCRGVKPLASADEFGLDYYCAFEDQVRWD